MEIFFLEQVSMLNTFRLIELKHQIRIKSELKNGCD